MIWKLVAISLLILASPAAHAYLDPGSGSAILQGVLGALAAIGITLKLYWHRVLRLLGIRKPSTLEDDKAVAAAARHDTARKDAPQD